VQSKQEAEVQPVKTSVADSNIRVSVEALDDLMNLVGELVLARNQILQFTTTQEDVAFIATSQSLNLITTELQAKVMKTRMQPIRVVWNKFPRVVRDLGQAFGKQIELVMEGAGTELDKTVVEAIKDPLTHIVRNSCDHGIESTEERIAAGKPAKGRLLLRAYHEGGQVNIEISDDGAGIDVNRVKEKALSKGLLTPERAERMSEAELVKLVFMPGFSTAETVTSVSGRGVGMDVVRTNIEKIGGSIDLQSVRGQGATLRIKIPLTLAIIPALVVTCGGERFAIPQVNLLELVRVESGQGRQQVESIHGAPVYRLRGKLLPLIYLHDSLRLTPSDRREEDPINIVVLQADDRTFGLVVDDVRDTAEIVVKPLSKLLKGLACYAGATVMGDGRVALILDVMGVAHAGKVLGEGHSTAHSSPDAHIEGEADRQKVLMFRCGEGHRLAVPLALVDRLEEFPRDRIEVAGTRTVVQYRGGILPLIQLGDHVDSVGDYPSTSGDKVQVIVFSEGATRFGVLAEEIVDIVEEAITIRARSDSAGLLGSVVIGEQVTDFIDVRHLISRVQSDTAARGADVEEGARVLVVDPSSFSRALLRGDLEMMGHRVVEARDVADAFDRLGQDPIDIIVSSLDLPDSGSYQLLNRLRRTPEFSHIPALGLRAENGFADQAPLDDLTFDELLNKRDRDEVLASITRLAHSVTEAETVEV
jgi:two-component system chemotaxis sensor kinase CheA